MVLSSINDNQFSLSPPVQLSVKYGDLNLVSSANKVTFQETVNLHVVSPVRSVKGPLQKKNVSPSHVKRSIKSVNSALCVNQCLFVPNVKNVPGVVKSPPVGGRLQLFWQVWLSLGSNPRVVSILKEGYQLPMHLSNAQLSYLIKLLILKIRLNIEGTTVSTCPSSARI